MNVAARAGDTIDALCWRELGSTAHVEAVYALNPGIAAQGPILQTGQPVQLPNPATLSAPVSIRETVKLWG